MGANYQQKLGMMLLSKFVVFIVKNRGFFMCSRVSNVLSGVPRLIDPVVAVLSSVSSKVSSVAQAHWTSLAGEEVSGDSSSHWEYIKNQCRICWGMASACIQQVAQTYVLKKSWQTETSAASRRRLGKMAIDFAMTF